MEAGRAGDHRHTQEANRRGGRKAPENQPRRPGDEAKQHGVRDAPRGDGRCSEQLHERREQQRKARRELDHDFASVLGEPFTVREALGGRQIDSGVRTQRGTVRAGDEQDHCRRGNGRHGDEDRLYAGGCSIHREP